MGAESFAKNMEKGLIEVAPLAYMRGRTLDNAFYYFGRSSEYDTGTDEDVPDPYRVWIKSCHHR